MKAREGDFIETIEDVIFDVKGMVHPPDRVVAFPRYIPDPNGDRRRGVARYRKIYALKDRQRLLEKKYPHYIRYDPVFDEKMSEVPYDHIRHHYRPQENMKQLQEKTGKDPAQKEAVEFIERLVEISGISPINLGISGSISVNLHSPASDIDAIVYGSDNCMAVHRALKKILADREASIKAYNVEGLKRLYAFRVKDTKMPFKDFLRHEARKAYQGTFKGRDFFVRYVKDWDEVTEQYGETRYRTLGQWGIKGRVWDASEALFTPCRYLLQDARIIEGSETLPVKEICSFRGRFCQHVNVGEIIVAYGKLEEVKTKNASHYRLLIGGTPQDIMVSI